MDMTNSSATYAQIVTPSIDGNYGTRTIYTHTGRNSPVTWIAYRSSSSSLRKYSNMACSLSAPRLSPAAAFTALTSSAAVLMDEPQSASNSVDSTPLNFFAGCSVGDGVDCDSSVGSTTAGGGITYANSGMDVLPSLLRSGTRWKPS